MLSGHLISDERVDEVVVGTEDDVRLFHKSSSSKVWARLQGSHDGGHDGGDITGGHDGRA